METEPKRKRRWFQFSLRTLMITTAVVAAAAAILETRIERKRKERESAEALEELGGFVYYDSYKNEPSGPGWLRMMLGDSFFSEVVSVGFDFSRRPLGDAELANLERFPNLRDLNIRGCSVSADGIAHVKGLSQLVWIDFQGSNINDDELVNLKRLANLQDLRLQKTQVTDAGINELKKALPTCKIVH
jgi:hypothetical protein